MMTIEDGEMDIDTDTDTDTDVDADVDTDDACAEDARTIYVVDDNDDFRESTSWMLEGAGYTVYDSADPQQALADLASLDKDLRCCLLLDVRMPGMNGLEFHDCLNERKLAVPVVYMSGHADIALAVEAMKKGAVTFIEKPLKPASLEAALALAFQPVTRQRVARESESELRVYKTRIASLTPREQQVAQRMIDGKVNKVTALELEISIRTVELHRSRIMKKLQVNSALELVRVCMLCQ